VCQHVTRFYRRGTQKGRVMTGYYYCRVCGSYSMTGKCPNCGRVLANEGTSEAQKDQ
jgi:hypothetical protein